MIPRSTLPAALALALSASAALASRAPGPTHGDLLQASDRDIVVALARAAAGEPSERVSAAAHGLRSLGTPAIPGLFDALVRGAVPVDAERNWRVEEADREAIFAVLEELPGRDVRRHARSLATPQNDWPSVRVAARVLGEVGRVEDVWSIATACAGADAPPRLDREHREVFSQATLRIIQRAPESLVAIEGLFHGIHPSLRRSLVEAVRDAETRDGLLLLKDWLGVDPGSDPMLLADIGRLASRLDAPFDPAVVDKVRDYLERREPALVMSAALAAAELDDESALPRLIEALEDEQRSVAVCAHRALKKLSGKRLRLNPDEWTTWYEAEMRWWREDRPRLSADLAGRDPGAVSNAINTMSRRHLFRHRLVPDLVRELDRDEPALVIMTCAALGALGSHLAVRDLALLLDHPDPPIVDAAWKALRRITGRDLPADSPDWLRLGA